jgi:predicted small secreted protein
MHIAQFGKRKSLWLVISLATALAFVLTACGSNTSSGSGSDSTSSGNTPAPISTSATNGCPNNTVINTASTPANIVLKTSNSNKMVTAHQGDVIEIQLPFGQMWNGPTTSQGALQLQTPYGYVSQTANSCIWRFTAQGSGTTQLSFFGKAICKKGQMCPQYVVSVPFNIQVN